ncbi:MAG: mannose-phosphate guanylyltransferase [Acidimicrobiaceae bacterium]|nr:mannose-phosphate guanylyltransferase [Acidimicrobiaceae bacterium]
MSPDVVVFLLAAGSGTRLAPLTESVPKPLIPLGDVPILERNIAALAAAGYRNLIINVHHLADTIMDQVGDGRRWGVSIHYSREKELLGTAGALQVQHERLQDSTFIVAYADNLLQCDLRAPLDAHRAAGATLTVTWIERADPGASGVVVMDPDGTVTAFIEKPGPTYPGPAPVNAGLLVAEPRLLSFIPANPPSDLSHHVIPALLRAGEHVHGVALKGRILWVDTPADLATAQLALAL